MSARKFKYQLFEAIQNLLWKQWTALGIPGQIATGEPETVLDPEALLLFSAGFARYDQRLYDLILDWLEIHCGQINIQRLKALYGKTEWKDPASLRYMARVLAATDPARWKKVTEKIPVEKSSSPTALFRDQDDREEMFIPTRDPLAYQCGFLRNVRQKTNKVPMQLPRNTASLLLQMRGLLGISARAETILILLSQKHCKVQDIVDHSGFSWKSIQDVLEELSAGNLVSSLNGNQRGKIYFLNDPEKFRIFFNVPFFRFPLWTNLFDAIGLLREHFSNPHFAEVSAETFQNEVKYLYDNRIQRKLLDFDAPRFTRAETFCTDFIKFLSTL